MLKGVLTVRREFDQTVYVQTGAKGESGITKCINLELSGDDEGGIIN